MLSDQLPVLLKHINQELTEAFCIMGPFLAGTSKPADKLGRLRDDEQTSWTPTSRVLGPARVGFRPGRNPVYFAVVAVVLVTNKIEWSSVSNTRTDMLTDA